MRSIPLLLASLVFAAACDSGASSPSTTGSDSAASGTCQGCPNVTKEAVCTSTPTCHWIPADGGSGTAGPTGDGGTASGYCEGCPHVEKEAICKITPTCTWVPYP